MKLPRLLLVVVLLATAATGFAVAGDIDEQLSSAEDLIGAGRSAEAIRVLKRLRAVETRDARIPFLLLQCEFNLWRADRKKTEHLERARRYIEDCFLIRKPWPECSFLSGWLEFEAQNWEAAERACREAIKGRYRVAESRQRLAISLFHRGVKMAEGPTPNPEIVEQILRVFTEARDRLRVLALDTRLLPAQRKHFQTYWVRAWSNLAAMYQRTGQHPEAIRELEELRKAEPDNPLHCYNLGLLQVDVGAWKKAVELFQRSLEIGKSKGFLEPHLQLAALFSTHEKREEADKHFATYLEHYPKSWSGYYERGEHYRRFGEYEKSVKDYLTCLSIDPKRHEPMKVLAESYRQMGDTEKANEWLKKYLKRHNVKPPAEEEGEK